MQRLHTIRLLITLAVALAPGTHAQTTYPAVLFDGSTATPWVRLMALTLAGIVNRDSARLYLQNVYETWSNPQTDEQWAELYRTRGNVQFEVLRSDTALVNRFRSFIRGGIRYDYLRTTGNFPGQSFMWQGEYAALIGGLTDRLPLTFNQWVRYRLAIDDSVLVNDPFDGDPPVWVPGKLDTSSLSWNAPGLTAEAERYLTMLDWGIRVLLPRCDPKRFYLREITDFTVQQRMFQMNLGGTDELKIDSIPAARFDLLERTATFLHERNPADIFHVYGWVRPESFTQWLACFGASFHETLLANISWHSAFPAPRRTFTPPATVRDDTVSVRDRRYLLFLASEGDAGNWVYSLQGGAWSSPRRGRVPLGWGWNLHLLDLAPFVASYYFDTATAADGFVSVLTPLGFSYPDLWPDGVLQAAPDSSRALMERFGVRSVYGYKHYEGSGARTYRGKLILDDYRMDRYTSFQNSIGAASTIFFNSSPAPQRPTAYGTVPFLNHKGDGSFYADVSNLPAAAARVASAAGALPRPGFLLASYQRFRSDDLAPGSLGTEDLTVTRLDSLVRLVRADPAVGASVDVVTPEYFAALMRKHLGLTASPPDPVIPAELALDVNYPNPFNATTTLRYVVPDLVPIRLRIFDLLGRETAVLAEGRSGPGVREARWDASGAASGVYLAVLETPGRRLSRRIVLLR